MSLCVAGCFGYLWFTKVLVDGICVIQGMVKNGAKGTVVAVLPAECRPRERLTFNMNLKQSVARVDVLTSGSIRFQASGSWTTTWLSLSGIHFQFDLQTSSCSKPAGTSPQGAGLKLV